MVALLSWLRVLVGGLPAGGREFVAFFFDALAYVGFVQGLFLLEFLFG